MNYTFTDSSIQNEECSNIYAVDFPFFPALLGLDFFALGAYFSAKESNSLSISFSRVS